VGVGDRAAVQREDVMLVVIQVAGLLAVLLCVAGIAAIIVIERGR
jgi:hypothetical protein